jgi:hypothetical protein
MFTSKENRENIPITTACERKGAREEMGGGYNWHEVCSHLYYEKRAGSAREKKGFRIKFKKGSSSSRYPRTSVGGNVGEKGCSPSLMRKDS